jgi:hypothetical protein
LQAVKAPLREYLSYSEVSCTVWNWDVPRYFDANCGFHFLFILRFITSQGQNEKNLCLNKHCDKRQQWKQLYTKKRRALKMTVPAKIPLCFSYWTKTGNLIASSTGSDTLCVLQITEFRFQIILAPKMRVNNFVWNTRITSLYHWGNGSYAVAQSVQVLLYKPEGCGFDSR